MAITEKELLLPALYLIKENEKMNTTELIKSLTDMYQPVGHDAEIISGRNDTFFSQKVRNLTGSHYANNGMRKYTVKDNKNKLSLTPEGDSHLKNNKENLDTIFNSGFSYNDKSSATKKIANEEKDKKVIILDENITISEGETKTVKTKVKTRSAQLRSAAVKHFANSKDGLKCCVCGFDFKKKYGQHGKNYIEIHHEKPVSQYEQEDIENTIKDAINNLKPLCSNCHKMIHRNPKQPLSIAELKQIVKENENDN